MPKKVSSEKSTLDRIRDEAESLLGVDPEEVTLSANIIEDLGADSLDLVEFVMQIEENFNIEIPDEDAMKVSTIGDAVKLVDAILEKEAANVNARG